MMIMIIFSMAKGPRLAVSMGSSLEPQGVLWGGSFFFKDIYTSIHLSEIPWEISGIVLSFFSL